MEPITAYCMKCKTAQIVKDVQFVTTRNGRPAAQGVCPVCGTKMFKFLKSLPPEAGAPAPEVATESSGA